MLLKRDRLEELRSAAKYPPMTEEEEQGSINQRGKRSAVLWNRIPSEDVLAKDWERVETEKRDIWSHIRKAVKEVWERVTMGRNKTRRYCKDVWSCVRKAGKEYEYDYTKPLEGQKKRPMSEHGRKLIPHLCILSATRAP